MKRAVAIAIDERNSVPLHFALARAYHDRKLHAEAFDHYREANRQRAESLGYNARELTEEIAELERVVTADFVRALPAVAGGGDSVPKFIVRLPRPGSTLPDPLHGRHGHNKPAG